MKISDSVQELIKRIQQQIERKRISDYEKMHRPKRKKLKLPADHYFRGTKEEIKEYMSAKK